MTIFSLNVQSKTFANGPFKNFTAETWNIKCFLIKSFKNQVLQHSIYLQLSDVAISDYLYLTQVRLLSIFATHSLTHSRFGDVADVTLAFEDANSDVDAEERLGSVVPLPMFLINEP